MQTACLHTLSILFSHIRMLAAFMYIKFFPVLLPEMFDCNRSEAADVARVLSKAYTLKIRRVYCSASRRDLAGSSANVATVNISRLKKYKIISIFLIHSGSIV